MTKFTLDSDNLFINCFGDWIRVFKNKNLHEPFLNTTTDWEKVTEIDIKNGLELQVFNCTIQGPKLQQLADELGRKCEWLVNREGCLYSHNASRKCNAGLNDYFCWSKYGVNPTRRTFWNKFELETKTVVVDLVEKDKLLAEYKCKLEEKEKELSSCKKQLEETEKKLSACEKNSENVGSLLEKKEKELSSCEEHMNKMKKELSNLEIRCREKDEEFKIIEKELSRIKKSLDERTEDLKDAKVELKEKRKRLAVVNTLRERYLRLFDQQEDDMPNQQELLLCNEETDKLRKELEEVKYELVVERRRANVFKIALKCLVTYLEDFKNECR